MYWNVEFIKPLREKRISFKIKEFGITPDFQAYFTNTKLTTKFLDDLGKETVFDKLKNVGFCDNLLKIRLKAARMKDALYNVPKVIDKTRNPPSPSIENVEDSSDLQGEGVKIIIPSNIIDIYTRLEVILGLKLSGHFNTLTEASNLIDELYKQGEVHNKQQYRNVLNKFSTQ